jgi:Tol biopolymer transport system component
MLLTPGLRLGAYEILTELGAGGMGEVYRARDTNLHRDVALKLLPEAFKSDAERVARFRREAQVLASLNHPHIGAIYGFEESSSGQALVLELVEGPTLAQLIVQGPIPLDRALPIAKQIAEALESAHEQGIIHRDLKPANIKVRPDGTVKVLDFGLAKILEGVGQAFGGPSAAEAVLDDLTCSPTLTSPGTQLGVILGTAAYMSPEQARGQAIDRRADLWAFGCVLFEMLAGRPAFAGATLTDIVAAVVRNEPDWQALPAETPAIVRRLLQRCLQKDTTRRAQHAGDVRIEIEDAVAAPIGTQAAEPVSRSRTAFTRIVPWTIAVASVAAFVTDLALRRPIAPPGPPVIRLELNMPAGVELGATNTPNIALSPDGTRIAFTGAIGGLRRLYVRRLDEFEAAPIKNTDTVNICVFAPDGGSLAFITTTRLLQTVSLADGLVTTIAGPADFTAGGLVWGLDGWITFARGGELWQVPAKGGSAQKLTTLDTGARERLHAWPTAVGDRRAILFTVVTAGQRTTTHIDGISLDTGQRRRVIENGRNPIYASSGHVVFFRDGAMLAVPFDADRLETTGPAVAVLQNVGLDPLGAPILMLSHLGSLAYIPSSNSTKRLVWVSREGVEQPILDIARPYQNPRLAPDGQRIVVEVGGGDLWLYDLRRTTFTPLTTGLTFGNTFGAWFPDAHRIAFRTLSGIHTIDPEGGLGLTAIANTGVADIPTSVSPDGKTLAFIRQNSDTSGDMYTLPLDGSSAPRPFVVTAGYDGGGQFSPDGSWFAYVTNESGQFEVFVRPYPGPDRRVPVSTEGGTGPRWNPNGKELFYRLGNRMMVVDVASGPDLKLSKPRVLFEQRYTFGSAQTIGSYDVAADGQRFVMVKDDSGSGRLNIVLNWLEELKARVPTK